MSKSKIIIMVVAVVGVVFIFYGRAGSYESAVVENNNIREFLSAPGKIISEREASLTFKATGKISKLPFKEGDLVKKGDIVAQIDMSELTLTLGKERDSLREAEAELAKVYDEVKGHDADETYAQKESRTQAEVKRDRAVKSVISAQKALGNSSLIAPFDSTVIDVGLELNEWVSSFSLDEYHIKLADLTNIYFEAEVNQESISKIQIGQKAVIRLDTYEDKQFDGEVLSISKMVDKTQEGDTVVAVKISFSNLPDDTILGLEGDAEIILLSKENVLTIPKSAPFKEDKKNFVTVSGQKKEVKLGIFDGTRWEVVSGLSEGEKVSW